MKADELREKYLTFFESKGCVRRPSDVLVPRWDPSVLFTPAGMNQFKDHFLGRCKLDFTRATTCQKCLRTGDIDNVGRTAYHHTFFEMLGNFSFGDYFKREAIHWAWEFLTDKKWLGLPPERLSATVYLDDDEAAAIWVDEIGLPSERVGRLGEDENFWPANAPSQGPDGVCGPCSEIYYRSDFGEVEIWNLVFTQFERVGEPPDNLRPLPSKNIDTGMGFERTAAVLQGVETNFHIDILRPLVEAAGEVCGMKYEPESESGRRLRRIADHIRACAFAIHENVYPGPNKEKYVIRRLLRRAVLDAHQMGVRRSVLHQLTAVVAELMQHPYPELGETVSRVAKAIENEESSFLGTIDAGLSRIDRVFDEMRRERRGVVPPVEAADMYDTHGFPPELFEASTILCPNRPMWLDRGEPFARFYRQQQAAGRTLQFYSCSGPARLLDPYAYYRLQAWECWQAGATGSFFWAFGDNSGVSSWNEYLAAFGPYTPLFLDDTTVTAGKQMEAIRESAQDYEYFVMLRDAVARAEAAGRSDDAVAAAKALLADGAGSVLSAEGVNKLRWDEPKDRTLADAVRVQILQVLTAL